MVADFAPDLVVAFGADHARAFPDIVPSFAVVKSATGYGDWGTSEDAYDVDPIAAQFAEYLVDDGYDVTVAEKVRLDHGLGQTFEQLLGALDAVPSVPIIINCARPPLPSVARAIGLGRSVRKALEGVERRVLIVGSGGLSHAPPSLEIDTRSMSEQRRRDYNLDRIAAAGKRIEPEWDRTFLDAMERADLDWISGLDSADVLLGGVGANEVRTWAAASAAIGRPLQTVAYEPVPEWITGMGLAVAPSGAPAKRTTSVRS